MSLTNGISEESTYQSHKGTRIESYTLKFKLHAVRYTELNSIRDVARKFNVDVN